MSLPLQSLSLTAILQPLFEVNQLVTELRLVKASFQTLVAQMSHPEVSDHVQAISAHLDQTIAFYESLSKSRWPTRETSYVNT